MDDKLKRQRHSLSHILAQAVKSIYPKAKLGIGPAIDTGFYYDIDFGGEEFNDEILPILEEKMREIIKKDLPFTQSLKSRADAVKYLNESMEDYKIELINTDIKDDQIGFYSTGNEYVDMCEGPHVKSTGEIKLDAFKLSHLAGAYWKGNEKNKMLTRIYGLAFESKEELEKYVELQEEAKRRDHRKLGKLLDLFTFSELVGSGLPLFTPKGTILRDQLSGFSEQLQKDSGFQKVAIPHITKIDLYKKSGHWDKFGGELFLVQSQETNDQFAMKPMNCPHHAQIYASRIRSYKDLPIRYYETTVVYRDEKAGEMMGLSRVRSITQDDAHIFCRPDQIEAEFSNIMSMIKTLYSALGMNFKARLSFRDAAQPEKYLGDDEHWTDAQKSLENIAKKLELDYFIAEGEAAFYGPKIDIIVIDALGREWQCATEQLDFVQPMRFGLKYTDQTGTEKTPVMIHKALLGSIERFLSVYIEHTAGNFPLWLSPVQAIIIPIGEKHVEYAKGIMDKMKVAGLRVELDDANERMQNKIRVATEQKVPYMLVLGDKEIEKNVVSVRLRNGNDLGVMYAEELIERMVVENKEKR
ncbi:MAG: threonine--tRNA ligase [bacterium]